MSQDRRSLRALAQLLPSGAFGLSVGLAAADASATASPAPEQKAGASVADRLQSIRTDVSSAIEQYRKDGEPFVSVDPEQHLAWWGNGWHRGWGWRNGGWGNGWHNGGWGNGGWGNGWHNGWGNGWHNW